MFNGFFCAGLWDKTKTVYSYHAVSIVNVLNGSFHILCFHLTSTPFKNLQNIPTLNLFSKHTKKIITIEIRIFDRLLFFPLFFFVDVVSVLMP